MNRENLRNQIKNKMKEPNNSDIDYIHSFVFELDDWMICFEDGKWWAEFSEGDEDVDVLVVEDDETPFEETEELLSIGLTQDLFETYKRIVNHAENENRENSGTLS